MPFRDSLLGVTTPLLCSKALPFLFSFCFRERLPEFNYITGFQDA